MGRITIPVSSQKTFAEIPYFLVQIIPDRIKYQISGDVTLSLLKGFINGSSGWNAKIEDNLEVLAKLKVIESDGELFLAWLAYSAAAADSKDLRRDPAMMTALENFQRLACTNSSYGKLPPRAAQAAFWEKPSEVVLPRITEQEHKRMG